MNQKTVQAYFATAQKVGQLEVENGQLRAALRCFLDDPRFQVVVGGNPIAVDAMLANARALLNRKDAA